MAETMLVPRVNTNDDEVEIVHWYVEDKQFVEKGQEIVDVESSKAVVTIESEVSGYILTQEKVGGSVRVGTLLASFYPEVAELDADLNGATATADSNESEVNSNTSQENIALSIPQQNSSSHSEANNNGRDTAKSSPVAVEDRHNHDRSSQNNPEAKPEFGFTRFSAAASEYIKQNNLDSVRFEGMGLVSVAAIEASLGLTAVSSPTVREKPAITDENLSHGNLRSQKVGKSKRIEIELLSAGQAGGINSSLTVQFDSLGIRQTLEETGSLGGQVLPLILYEMSHLIEEYPAFNAYYQAEQIFYYDRVNIGIAIDLGQGLKVPIINDTNLLSPVEISESVVEYATQYLDNNLQPSDFAEGTITVTDLSNEDILHFQPLLNKHQSIILGIGGDRHLPGHPMTLTIVFDHRVLAGREVSLFLNKLKQRLLSYAIGNLAVTNQQLKAKNIECSKCLINLDTLYEKFSRDALMQVYINEQGETDYICHRCIGGF